MLDPFEHPTEEPWSNFDKCDGWDTYRGKVNWLYRMGLLNMHGRHISPAIPLQRVRVVISQFERGTASQKAYDWLLRTEADDNAVVESIREWS